MARPESIAAPTNPRFGDNGLMSLYLDYIQGDPTAQQVTGGDPLKKALRGISEFIPGLSTELAQRRGDGFGEALSYLDVLGPAGAGAKGAAMASVFLIARQEELKRLLKAIETDPLIKGNQQLKNKYEKEMSDNAAALTETTRRKIQHDELIADPSRFGKTPVDIPELATQISRNEKAGTPLLFHGSNRGIDELENRMMYLSETATDPRFTSYAKKKGMVMQPTFSKTLDIDNIPSEMDQVLTNLEMYRGRPSRGKPAQLDFDLETLRGRMPGISNKLPNKMDPTLGEIFKEQGYDALKFPPRTSKLLKDETSTYLALDPKNTLKVFEDLNPEQIPELIQELLRNKFE
jgi:hypothetical protein